MRHVSATVRHVPLPRVQYRLLFVSLVPTVPNFGAKIYSYILNYKKESLENDIKM